MVSDLAQLIDADNNNSNFRFSSFLRLLVFQTMTDPLSVLLAKMAKIASQFCHLWLATQLESHLLNEMDENIAPDGLFSVSS